MMASSGTAERQVRISRIAGRYLVFDIDDVAYIRRHHGICAVFTGTMPQNPTQNVFLGLPVELYAEEAKLLVDKKAGYIADDLADHLSQLKALDPAARAAYFQSLKTQRRNAQLVIDEDKAKSLARHMERRKAATVQPDTRPSEVAAEAPAIAEGDSLFDAPPTKRVSPPVAVAKDQTSLALTPTTSSTLIVPQPTSSAAIEVPSSYPLYAYLNQRGYFITPGLRFGGDYSVYPGDPFRYHAHYLANSYEWDTEIPMLDIVTSGRLGTAVKKSYLLGGQAPEQDPVVGSEKTSGEVRVFCIEWAGM
ncbi:hypothetical protein B0T17DRAFT_204653 [Bombardia bombarda]|uniref:tRNA-splicing endonuclease subunit Sen34 n=1 Tax=Bombardia bombarda TaxID=252184 RepID=A0AA39XA34_9PEZI|nr:hypothetical protein B0T17DRAFT_204653 [Bombardia bombarda]